jgi:uncharacterized protein (DUF302 family)
MINKTWRALAGAAALGLLSACANIGSPIGSYNGVVALKSPHSASETMNRLEAQVKQRGLVVLARVDHAAAAARAGRTLRPTELLIFGNPQAGTPLMECVQSVGIDLPMKALVWVDVQQQVWLAYNDPEWLVQRHTATRCPAAKNVADALAGIAEATVAP